MNVNRKEMTGKGVLKFYFVNKAEKSTSINIEDPRCNFILKKTVSATINNMIFWLSLCDQQSFGINSM